MNILELNGSFVLGRSEDENSLIGLLLGGQQSKSSSCLDDNVGVIPIVGDAGLGKTTLAKLVYNDPRVQGHFDLKMWVSFSECYPDVIRLTESLIKSANGNLKNDEKKKKKKKQRKARKKAQIKKSAVGDSTTPPLLDNDVKLEGLQSNLGKLLLGKRFLLVLDGVSNEICCDWNVLKVPFWTGANTSRILVTTRSPLVSSTLGTTSPYPLQPLSYEVCWSLFRHLAFGDSNNNISSTVGTPTPLPPPKLLQYCEEVVKSFRGYPSVVAAVGFLLRSCLRVEFQSRFLRRLRFLDLSMNYIKHLPETMSRLHNLQTLRIISHVKILRFPRDMGKLVNLRHLDLGIGYQAFLMPPGLEKLVNLQTLHAFTMDGEFGRIEVLRKLVNLRSLLILKLENLWRDKEMSKGDCLVDKKYLHNLELVWSYKQDAEIAESILSCLQPHTNLKHLKVLSYNGLIFPAWIGNPSFSNLETVQLCDSQNCEFLPPLGQLPLLKSLLIYGHMDELKYIDGEFCGNNMVKTKRFPSLKTLELRSLSCLETWAGLVDGDMPLLQELIIDSCDMLISLPTLQFLNSLQLLCISSCQKLQDFPDERPPSSLNSMVISLDDTSAFNLMLDTVMVNIAVAVSTFFMMPFESTSF
ncbi:Disease resistance protein [Macleaya cordata]|uniref:Disease resistance protein n=1 Tax=Macleaya cordata TaxID=56857 RepID=A0A200Q074_MACCD|nr:Disease resistance protein [Macleaya cordata]